MNSIILLLLAFLSLFIWALQPYITFSAWRSWFDQYDPDKQYRCIPLTSMAYYYSPRILYTLVSQFTKESDAFKQEWWIDFLMSLMVGQAIGLTGGVLTPKMLCDSLVPDPSELYVSYGDYVRIKQSGTEKYISVCSAPNAGLTLSTVTDDRILFQVTGGAIGSFVRNNTFSLTSQSTTLPGAIAYLLYKAPGSCDPAVSVYINYNNPNPTLVTSLTANGIGENFAYNVNSDLSAQQLNNAYITSCGGTSCSNDIGLTRDYKTNTKWVFIKDPKSPKSKDPLFAWPTDIPGWKTYMETNWGQSWDGTNWTQNLTQWQSNDNFLHWDWAIPADSPLIEGLITNRSNSKASGVILYPAAINALLGQKDSGAGGWYGFLRAGGWTGIDDVYRYVWSQDSTPPILTPKITPAGTKTCDRGAIALSSISTGVALGFLAATAPVAAACGPFAPLCFVGAIAIGATTGGLLTASSQKCL